MNEYHIILLLTGYQVNDRLFDDQEYRSEVFQRPLYYLHCMDTQQQPIAFNSSSNLADKKDCLKTLLRFVSSSLICK